jgi:hypothetical protein
MRLSGSIPDDAGTESCCRFVRKPVFLSKTLSEPLVQLIVSPPQIFRNQRQKTAIRSDMTVFRFRQGRTSLRREAQADFWLLVMMMVMVAIVTAIAIAFGLRNNQEFSRYQPFAKENMFQKV